MSLNHATCLDGVPVIQPAEIAMQNPQT